MQVLCRMQLICIEAGRMPDLGRTMPPSTLARLVLLPIHAFPRHDLPSPSSCSATKSPLSGAQSCCERPSRISQDLNDLTICVLQHYCVFTPTLTAVAVV
jgi:hypothetical protein